MPKPPVYPKPIIPFLWFGRGKKEYSDRPKYNITLKWDVKNPIFNKFSIKERGSKKGRTIEWKI
jgi:hypothetical protein